MRRKSFLMKRKIFKILLILFCSGLLLGATTFGAYFYMLSPLSKSDDALQRLKVPSGTRLRRVADDLEQENIIRSSTIFYLYGRIKNVQLKAGIYDVSPSMSVQDISTILASGKQGYVRVSIPEGLTITKIARLLEKNEVTNAIEFIAASKDPALLAEFNIPAQNFEGYIFPDTYNFDPEMPAKNVIRLMVDTFFSKISTNEAFSRMTPKQLHKTVTLASIIEREYRIAKEAPLIASVFTNRLKKNIGLYSCATVEYIITEIKGLPHPKLITIADTQINNPYNTYKWAGLPPGAISNPGLTALFAAASPADTGYYYFRLIDPVKGIHIFTTNLNDHEKAGLNLQTKNAPGE